MSKSLITLLISTFARNNFKFKESTLLLTDFFFQTDEVFKRNLQVPEDIRPRFYSFAT